MAQPNRQRTVAAFNPEEASKVHELLAIRVAHMMGRKMEEGDWAEVYCRSKGIPLRTWSNLDIDVMHGSLGVEHKMVRYRSSGDIAEACGTSIMHPSATRSIRVPATSTPADKAMRDVLGQYADLIKTRTAKVKAQSGSDTEPDMRTGWLLWQDSLRQFLYFEEHMSIPEMDSLEAKWFTRVGKGGSRKASTNLWVFDRATGSKKYSITTEAGAKIQPYFSVPPMTDPNLYIFTVIGEVLDSGLVRVWLSEATARELARLAGPLDTENLSRVVIDTASKVHELGLLEEAKREAGRSFLITKEAYSVLEETFVGVSDEHRFQLLTEQLRNEQS
ncbi:MAG TPA: hypothetical protein VGM11_12280 [Acidobacteriaceae bacterium]